MLTLAQRLARLSIEERMRKFDELVRAFGYRSPTKIDLVPGAELLMVDVEHYMEPHNQGLGFTTICSTRIKLDDVPIKPSNADGNREVVYYHCTVPSWNGQCFVQLDDFCASGYVEGCYANDTRWVIKT